MVRNVSSESQGAACSQEGSGRSRWPRQRCLTIKRLGRQGSGPGRQVLTHDDIFQGPDDRIECVVFGRSTAITDRFTHRSVSKSPAAKRVASKNNGALLHAELIIVKVARVDSTGCAGGRLSVSGLPRSAHRCLPAPSARLGSRARSAGPPPLPKLSCGAGTRPASAPPPPCRINQRKHDNSAIAAPRT